MEEISTAGFDICYRIVTKQRLTSREMLGLRLELQILARSSAHSRTVAVWDVLKGK